MEQKLNIQVTGNELTIREGKALDLKPKEKVSLSGTITAPGDYALTRASTFDKLSCNVLANYTSRTIVLTINEGDPLASLFLLEVPTKPLRLTLTLPQPMVVSHSGSNQ